MTIFLTLSNTVSSFVRRAAYRLIYLPALFLVLAFSVSVNASKLAEQREVFTGSHVDGEYRLTLGALKSVNATLVAEREIVLQGRIERKTLEFVTELQYAEAWGVVQDEIIDSSDRVLFACDGYSCGSSNAWANSRFEIKQLYGLDQTQKYRAFVNDETNEFLVVYFVQRGNKRLYVQVDRVFASSELGVVAESPSTIASLIERQGYYGLPARTNGFDAQQFGFLVKALKSQPMSKFYLVGHCYSEQNQNANIVCAEQLAVSLQNKLVEQGIKMNRLDAQSVGALAPRGNTQRARVELVKKQR